VSSLIQDWSFANPKLGYVSSPVVANGMVYVGTVNGTLYALDAVTGVLKWRYTTGISSSPAVVNGMVYFSSVNTIYAFHLPGMS
jgi:outer membrane protein assembly factor BamB